LDEDGWFRVTALKHLSTNSRVLQTMITNVTRLQTDEGA
jgi:hypothetical protein